MLTAMDDDLDHAEGLDSGADDYLPKPFSYPVLLAHLRSLTRRTLGARPVLLAAAGLALDPAGRTATRDGAPLDLTSREAAVLEYLLRHKGHVVSKTELLEHCWDVNFDGEPGRRRGPHAPAAPQDRAARPAASDPDRARRGLHHPGPGMTAGADRVSAPPGGWRRLVRRAGPGTVRARVTAVAGLALTAAVVLGLVVMYRLQLNSADQTIQGELRTYATQIEQSAAGGTFPRTLPASDLGPTAQAQVLAPDGTVLAATRNWPACPRHSTRSRRARPGRSARGRGPRAA